MVIKLDDTGLAKEIIEAETEINKKANQNIAKSGAPKNIDFNNMQVGQLRIDEQNKKAYYKGNNGTYTWDITKV